MRTSSRLFELQRLLGGTHRLTFRRNGTTLDLAPGELDELFRFLGPLQEGQEVAWLRELDGSWHPCARTDPGATLFVGPPR